MISVFNIIMRQHFSPSEIVFIIIMCSIFVYSIHLLRQNILYCDVFSFYLIFQNSYKCIKTARNNENNDLWCKGLSFGGLIFNTLCGKCEQEWRICHKYCNVTWSCSKVNKYAQSSENMTKLYWQYWNMRFADVRERRFGKSMFAKCNKKVLQNRHTCRK